MTVIEERFLSAGISFFSRRKNHTMVKNYLVKNLNEVQDIENQINEDMAQKTLLDVKVSTSNDYTIFTVLYTVS